MKKTFTLYACLLCILFATSCSSKYEYWALSKFNIVPGSLQDGEEVKLLYSCLGPGLNKDADYYIHAVVVAAKSGDTVNVLTAFNNGFSENGGEKRFIFFSEDSYAAKLSHMVSYDAANTMASQKIDSGKLENYKTKNISRVARDPESNKLADNHYPAIVGLISSINSVNISEK